MEEEIIAERRSIWKRIFGGRESGSLSPRQDKVLRYITRRLGEGETLAEVIDEEYVRRNCSKAEVDQIIRHPDLIESAREQLGEALDTDSIRATKE